MSILDLERIELAALDVAIHLMTDLRRSLRDGLREAKELGALEPALGLRSPQLALARVREGGGVGVGDGVMRYRMSDEPVEHPLAADLL